MSYDDIVMSGMKLPSVIVITLNGEET